MSEQTSEEKYCVHLYVRCLRCHLLPCSTYSALTPLLPNSCSCTRSFTPHLEKKKYLQLYKNISIWEYCYLGVPMSSTVTGSSSPVTSSPANCWKSLTNQR